MQRAGAAATRAAQSGGRTSQDGRDEDGEQRADVDGEVEDGEEAAARLLVLVAAAELVGAEAAHARLDAARAERYQQQAHDRARAARVERVHVLVPVHSEVLFMLLVLDFKISLRYCLPRKRCQRHDEVAGRVHKRQGHDCPAQTHKQHDYLNNGKSSFQVIYE